VRPRALLGRLAERLHTSFWLVPGLCLLAAVGLSFAASALDEVFEDDTAWYLFAGGPEGGRSVLSTVASSTLTFTGLVFSVTILVLQQASRQFSPRVLRTFLADHKTQGVLGLFVGTFVYALLGLRSVRGASDGLPPRVPPLTIWLAVVLAVLCVATFIFYLHHVAQSIRAAVVLSRIGDESRECLGRLYPEGLGPEAEPSEPAPRRPTGVPALLVPHPGPSRILTSVDEETLWRQACRADVTVRLVPGVGDFLPEGAPLFEVWGDAGRLDVEALTSAVELGLERTTQQDVAFGLRQLVDVAELALSPGVNDPTTAVQALDQIHDLLRRLVRRRLPSPVRVDAQGRMRLILPRPGWDDFVRLGLDEVRLYGRGSLQVSRRLRSVLEDLRHLAPPSRLPVLLRQLELLDASVARSYEDREDARLARVPSPQGQGPA
jgi:uncharacterized membrane protein